MSLCTPKDVIQFWLGDLGPDGTASAEHRQRWFKKDPAFDTEIRDRFLDTHRHLAKSALQDWLDSASGQLAAILVLDQFSRNMFRDTPEVYATDAKALSIAESMIEAGRDRTFAGDARVFVYMPLMHAEDVERQMRCCQLFEAFSQEAKAAGHTALAERLGANAKYADAHRDIVARFGRFPHRNAILGRTSSPEEKAFLETEHSGF
jgi:uncharacterized protein (DUF924 family)